jgi:outer membrane beta-barrel protein
MNSVAGTKLFLKTLWFLPLLLTTLLAHAEVVTLADDELPNESVVPILDSPYAVQKRNLTFIGRWQGQFGTGWLLDEPFYQNMYLDGRVLYHWNETSGLGLRYMKWSKGVSSYGQQFTTLNFSYGHGPETGYGLVYENRFIYGKFSFSKNMVLPITMQSAWELGMIQYGTKSLPYGSVGLGNSVFFNTHFGVTLNVKFMVRQAFDPLSQNIGAQATTPPAEGDFTAKNRLGTGLDLGLIYLL